MERASGLDGKVLGFARNGELDRLMRVLDDQPQLLNALGPNQQTLLWEAAASGQIKVVAYLVERGAGLNMAGHHPPLPPYTVAWIHGHRAVAEFLVDAGAEIDFYSAVRLNQVGRVRALLGRDPALLNRPHPAAPPEQCALPLRYAIDGAHADLALWLLDEGAIFSPYDQELLGLAAQAGLETVVEAMLNRGANAVGLPLYGVTLVRYPSLGHILLNAGADVNASPPGEDWPPLVYESRGDRGNHPERIRALLKHGAKVNISGQGGRTALHSAAQAGFGAVIDVLLEYGADTERRNAKGQTPLAVAIISRRADGVYPLLTAGANPNVTLNRSLATPLHYAAKNGPPPLLEALLRAGADPTATDKHGRTPLDVARRVGNKAAMARIRAYMVD